MNKDQQNHSSEIDIAEASGMGDVTADDMQINGGDDAPFPAGEEPAPADDQNAQEADTEETDSSESSPEEGSEESEESSDSEESSERQKRTVPYSKLKTERQKRQEAEDARKKLESQVAQERSELRVAITELTNAIATINKNDEKSDDEDEASPDEIEQAASELRDELGDTDNLDEEGLAKVLRRAVDIARKQGTELPEEVQQKLSLLDQISKEREEQKESQQFTEEFQAYLPELKKQYPNASDAMLEEAKQELDRLAHSKDHHEHDLDYIVYKNKEKFDTLLKAAPNSRSVEQGRRYGSEASFEQSDSEDAMPEIDELTPEIMEQREQQSINATASSDKDYRVRGPVR